MKVYAVVPTYNREDLLWGLLRSIDVPLSRVLVINNGDPLQGAASQVLNVLEHQERPPNIQRMWNMGMGWAALRAGREPFATLLVNDDVEALGPLAEPLAKALAESGGDIAYPARRNTGTSSWVKRTAHTCDPWDPGPEARMTGWCFMVRGGSLTADEGFVWWYGDNDLEWRAQQGRGCVEVPGVRVVHKQPNVQTRASSELLAQTRLDRAFFELKWGRLP